MAPVWAGESADDDTPTGCASAGGPELLKVALRGNEQSMDANIDVSTRARGSHQVNLQPCVSQMRYGAAADPRKFRKGLGGRRARN